MNDLQAKLDELRRLLEGKIPDSAYAPLLRVVRQPCGYEWHELATPNEPCPECGNRNYSTRSWEGLPKGALGGAIWYAARDWPYDEATLWASLQFLRAEDPDLAALDAVIELVNE